MIGHNALATWASDIAALHAEIEDHNREAADKAIKAGKLLAEAKKIAGHGNWADWLASIDIGERTAQRYMQLHRYGLKSDTVTDLGGIGAALQWLQPVKLPKKGQVLLAFADEFAPDGHDLMGFVWPHGNGFHVATLDLRPEWPLHTKTKRAIRPDTGAGELPIWLTLWMACDWRCCDLTFQMVSDKLEVAAFPAMLADLAMGGGSA